RSLAARRRAVKHASTGERRPATMRIQVHCPQCRVHSLVCMSGIPAILRGFESIPDPRCVLPALFSVHPLVRGLLRPTPGNAVGTARVRRENRSCPNHGPSLARNSLPAVGLRGAPRPLDSALRLGRDAVRGSELFATKLNADVVALSACALGRGAEQYGGTEV